VARILLVYHRAPGSDWLPTYVHSLYSLENYSQHECLYLNTARSTLPGYVAAARPDLVVFHYTFLLLRQVPDEYARILRLIEFSKALECPKVLIAQDEQVRVDLLNAFVREFDVSIVFTPAAPSEWRQIYAQVDQSAVRFKQILTGYLDESMVARTVERSRDYRNRSIDVGYRSWYMQPFYGSHGQLKRQIGQAFKERAPSFGLRVNISNDAKDAFFGDAWFDFLLQCKYTIGVEGGCSVFDWDGSVARCTADYLASRGQASYEEVEAACFPGLDGKFRYFLMSPRHLEAVATRTCQVLIEGDYGGVLEAGKHYISLKRDLSNLDEILTTMKEDKLRAEIVERAYHDVVLSGVYSFRAFAEMVLTESLGMSSTRARSVSLHRRSILATVNRVDERLWKVLASITNSIRVVMRRAAGVLLGEERVRRLLRRVRRQRG